MSKGGSKTVQTQSSVDPFINPFYQTGLEEAERLYDDGGPGYYPGSTVVGMSPERQQALSMTRDRALGGSPLTQGAQGYTQNVLGGQFLGQNPFLQQALNPTFDAITDRVNSQFSQSGRYGSGAHADVLSQNLADTGGQLAYQNYQQERGRQDAASRIAPQMADLDYGNYDRLQGVGAQREAQSGMQLQDNVARYQFEQTQPQQNLADYLTAVRGGTFGQTQTQPVFQNKGAGALGGALGGAQLGSMMGINPLFGAIGGGLLGAFS